MTHVFGPAHPCSAVQLISMLGGRRARTARVWNGGLKGSERRRGTTGGELAIERQEGKQGEWLRPIKLASGRTQPRSRQALDPLAARIAGQREAAAAHPPDRCVPAASLFAAASSGRIPCLRFQHTARDSGPAATAGLAARELRGREIHSLRHRPCPQAAIARGGGRLMAHQTRHRRGCGSLTSAAHSPIRQRQTAKL